MKTLRKILSITLITMLFVAFIPNINVQTQAQEETSYYKSYYYVNEKGQYVQNRYHYSEEAQKSGVPEVCFQQIGTYVYEGKLDEKSYIVNTYKDPDQGSTPSDTKTYLKSEYIVWICSSNTPILSNIGSTSYNLLSSVKILSSDGLYIKGIDSTTPVVSVELDKNNPDLITNGKRQISSTVKNQVSSADVGTALVKIFDWQKSAEYLIKDILKTDWQEFSQFDKPKEDDNTSNTEIVAKKYNSQLERVRGFGYSITDKNKLDKENQNITLLYDITYPFDTPSSLKVKDRTLTTKYNFKVVGTDFQKNISKSYKINYTSTGDNKIDLNDLNVSVSAGEYYNGGAVKPKVTVSYFKSEPKCYLVEGQDYKVTYTNNTEIGTGKVIIEGINNYKGKITKEFSILLNKPNNLKSLSTSFTTLQIGWDKVSGVTGYEVYRSSNGKSYTRVSITSGTSYKDTGLSAGGKYYYKVRSYYTKNGRTQYSTFSTVYSTTTNTIVAPSNLTKQYSTYDSIQFAWSGVSGSTGYEVYRSSDGKSYTRVKITSATSYKDTGLSAGGKYYYKVRAYYTENGRTQYSTFSTVYSITTNTIVAPSNLTKQYSTYDSIQFAWSGVSGSTGYEVYRSSDGKSYTRVKITSATSYKDTGLTAGRKYYYKVRAYYQSNGRTQYSTFSTVYSITTNTIVAPSKLTKKNSFYDSIQFTWKGVSGVTGYEVYRSSDGKRYSRVKITSGTSYKDTGLTAGRKYYYKVRAYYKSNGRTQYSTFSKVYSITTKTIVAPSNLTKQYSSKNSIQFAWKGVSKATGYEVYRSSDGKRYSRVKTTSGTSYKDTGLTAGKKYYYKVRAYYKSNGKTQYSSFSTVYSITTN